MIFHGSLGQRPAMLSVKDTSISLAFEAQWVAAWDLGGRLYSLWKGGHTYRRGLSGRLLHKPSGSDCLIPSICDWLNRVRRSSLKAFQS